MFLLVLSVMVCMRQGLIMYSCMRLDDDFFLSCQNLGGIEVPIRAQYIRVMFDELTRIMNHLLAVGTHALDVGMTKR